MGLDTLDNPSALPVPCGIRSEQMAAVRINHGILHFRRKCSRFS